MTNPFAILEARLSNLEELILDLKHHTLPELLRQEEKEEEIFIKKQEAAAILNCAVSTIDNFRRDGLLKRHNLGRGSSVRFKKSEVLALAEKKQVAVTTC